MDQGSSPAKMKRSISSSYLPVSESALVLSFEIVIDIEAVSDCLHLVLNIRGGGHHVTRKTTRRCTA
jgi:hypothetical protein